MSFGAPHSPIQAPAALTDTYAPVYSRGWDVVRRERYDRMLADGVIDSRHPYPDRGPTAPHLTEPAQEIPAWDTLPADRKADLVRRMSLYAAMIEKMDENIGKVIARLSATGQLDNTLIFFLSDNGANHERGKFGSWTGSTTTNPLTGAELTNMGQPGADDGIHYGAGWAHVSNTPLRLFKRNTHEGGIRTPLIVHWPAGLAYAGGWTEQPGHIVDIMATVVAASGITYPTSFEGRSVLPLEGTSLLPAINGSLPPARPLFVEHEANRMIRKGKWKLVTKNFAFPDGSSPAHERELYDMSADPAETTNLAQENSSLVIQLVDEWNAWAPRVGLPADRLLAKPPQNITPAQTPADLFLDTFNRASSYDADASANGMSGSRVPPLGANTAWFEGFEGSGTPDSMQVVDNVLQMATGAGMSESGINHNFSGQDIIDAGGFSVSLRILEINTATSDPANCYAGFGVGLNAAQAAAGNDPTKDILSPRSIRGSVTLPGAADCFVELDINKNVKVWTLGILRATIPVGASSGTLTAAFECTGFGTADSVTVSVFFDGKRLDLSPSTAADTLSFNWNEANANFLALSARASNYVQMDNFAVRRLPLASALTVEYALSHGLDAADSAPTANSDDDRLDNYGEWSFGTAPGRQDDHVAGTVLRFTNLATDGFRFAHRRLADFQQAGLVYRYWVSTDLQSWRRTDPVAVSSSPLANSPGYEVVELRLPDSEVLNQDRLFVRIDTAQ